MQKGLYIGCRHFHVGVSVSLKRDTFSLHSYTLYLWLASCHEVNGVVFLLSMLCLGANVGLLIRKHKVSNLCNKSYCWFKGKEAGKLKYMQIKNVKNCKSGIAFHFFILLCLLWLDLWNFVCWFGFGFLWRQCILRCKKRLGVQVDFCFKYT